MTDPDQTFSIGTSSAEETIQVGHRIGAAVRPGQIIALLGPLGAGKTQLVKGIARGMGISDAVTSPTYVLVNEYGDDNRRLVHIDTYRLGAGPSSDTSVSLDAATFGFEDILADAQPALDGSGGSVVAIEWAERISRALPPDHLQVSLHTVTDKPQCRAIDLQAYGARSRALLKNIRR